MIPMYLCIVLCCIMAWTSRSTRPEMYDHRWPLLFWSLARCTRVLAYALPFPSLSLSLSSTLQSRRASDVYHAPNRPLCVWLHLIASLVCFHSCLLLSVVLDNPLFFTIHCTAPLCATDFHLAVEGFDLFLPCTITIRRFRFDIPLPTDNQNVYIYTEIYTEIHTYIRYIYNS